MGSVAEIVGKTLKQLIIARGYTSYEKFAHEYGLEKSALGKILRGERLPRIDTLIRIAQALEVSLDEIYPMPQSDLRRSKTIGRKKTP